MPRLTRPELIELCESGYFGNLVRERRDAVRACFTPDAVVEIRHGDLPVRRFFGKPEGDAPDIAQFWDHVNTHFAASFEDYDHVVDTEQQRIASTFLVTLVPKPGSPYVGRGTLQLKNCNFFWVEDGLIARMLVYYSNPDTGGDPVGKPSGYPPARRTT
jgi:ketosteroid isomerase-like protein